MIQQNSRSSVTLSLLGGFIIISACNSEQPSGQNAQQSPPNETTSTNSKHTEVGKASFYGAGLAGNETANGETFNQNAMTAAHPSLPMGTKAEVTNLANGKKVDITINDRGPVTKGRAIDVSSGVAKKLDMKKNGITKVKIVTKKAKTKHTNKAISTRKVTNSAK